MRIYDYCLGNFLVYMIKMKRKIFEDVDKSLHGIWERVKIKVVKLISNIKEFKITQLGTSLEDQNIILDLSPTRLLS